MRNRQRRAFNRGSDPGGSLEPRSKLNQWSEIQNDAKYVVILRNFRLSIINNCNETIEDSEQALTKLRAEFNQTLAVVYIRETLF